MRPYKRTTLIGQPIIALLILGSLVSCGDSELTTISGSKLPESPQSTCADSQLCTSLLNDAIGLYRGDTPDGTTLSDYSTQRNDASLGLSAMTDSSGYQGSGLLFTEGASERVTLSDSPLLNPDNLSIALWFKSPGASSAGFMSFAAKHSATSSRSGFVLGMTWSYHGGMGYVPWFAMKDAGGTEVCKTKQIADDLKNYNDDQWHHLVANISFVNGGTTELYVDGALFDSCANSAAIDSTGHDLLFGDGADSHWRTFNGRMDEIYLWDRSLSLDEVNHLYNDGLFY